jgi:lipoate-protein ligase A
MHHNFPAVLLQHFMQVLNLTLSSLPENLALDEALLSQAEAGQGQELLRFWEWPKPAVVLGAGGQVAQEIETAACWKAKIPIWRRASGGGTVLLGRGCLCFSLVLAYDRSPELRDVRRSYRFILGRLGEALDDVLPEIGRAGISDLAAGGLKFSGNAQERKRHFLLHHGTLLYDFDLSLMSRYLRLPSRQPEYRQGRGHGEFLRNLPCAAAELRDRLGLAWQADAKLEAWPKELVSQLVANKYARAEWIYRR